MLKSGGALCVVVAHCHMSLTPIKAILTLVSAPPEVSIAIDSSDWFIASEPAGTRGEAGEKKVWDAVRGSSAGLSDAY